MKFLIAQMTSFSRLAKMWLVWRVLTVHAFMLRFLDVVYAPGKPLPSVLRAEVAVALYGERYATAKKQDERARHLRARAVSTSAELDIRSNAIQQHRVT